LAAKSPLASLSLASSICPAGQVSVKAGHGKSTVVMGEREAKLRPLIVTRPPDVVVAGVTAIDAPFADPETLGVNPNPPFVGADGQLLCIGW